MKKLYGIVMMVAMVAGAEVQPLWPEGKIPNFQSSQYAAPSQDVKQPGFDAKQHQMPYLEWCEKPAKPNGTCVILISGGSYQCTCDGPAFRPLAKKLMDNGITCVWLWYRVPRPDKDMIYRSGWQDGQRAVRLVRAAAKARGIDPEKIGVLGCSAGSHLSVMLATSSQTASYSKVDATDEVPCHINFAIPMCPAYVLSDGLTGANAKKGDPDDLTLNESFKFDAKTCPMCFFHGGRDPYSPMGSVRLWRKLREMNIDAALHLDAGRGHGPVGPQPFDAALAFLRKLKFL